MAASAPGMSMWHMHSAAVMAQRCHGRPRLQLRVTHGKGRYGVPPLTHRERAARLSELTSRGGYVRPPSTVLVHATRLVYLPHGPRENRCPTEA